MVKQPILEDTTEQGFALIFWQIFHRVAHSGHKPKKFWLKRVYVPQKPVCDHHSCYREMRASYESRHDFMLKLIQQERPSSPLPDRAQISESEKNPPLPLDSMIGRSSCNSLVADEMTSTYWFPVWCFFHCIKVSLTWQPVSIKFQWQCSSYIDILTIQGQELAMGEWKYSKLVKIFIHHKALRLPSITSLSTGVCFVYCYPYHIVDTKWHL